MRSWCMLTVAFFFAFLPPFAYSSDQDNVFSKKLTEKNNCLEMSLAYPQFGWPEVDKTVRDWAASYFKKTTDDYNKACLEEKENGGLRTETWEFYNTWAVATTPGTISIGFDFESYTGGAHPAHWSENLTMDANGNLLRGYDDLFAKTDGLWEFLSKYADEALRREPAFMENDIVPDPAGLAPNAESFKHFTVMPKGLRLDFPEYQVAAYAFGPQSCFVPLEALAQFEPKPGLWDNFAPSFNCAKAGNPAEAAICQNPILARFDKDLANEYKRALSKAADQEALKTEQRNWLKKAQTQCSGPNKDIDMCLMIQYQARVAQLKGN